MGAVLCSAGMAEGNAEIGGNTLGFSGKLKKENGFKDKNETFSDSRSNGQGKNHKKQENGFSNEFGLSTSDSMGEKQVPFILFLFVYGD